MKVLLSINPEYVEKIFSGIKKYEFRRNIFKNEDVDTILIYSTSPVKRIVGEFKIKNIIKDLPENLWELAPENTGIDKKKFQEYFSNKEEGYAIGIKEVKKYKDPKLLEDFSIKKAPQSFTYLK